MDDAKKRRHEATVASFAEEMALYPAGVAIESDWQRAMCKK